MVSGVSDSKEASYLSTVTLPKRDGVITWNTKIDGTGVSYQLGDKLSVRKENVTLYTQSDVVVYQVTLNLNEGQLTNNFPTTYQSNEEVILPVKEEVIKEGYEFSGWYTTSDFQGEQHVHAVKEARASYNGLTIYGKQFVTNLSTLQKAERSVKKIENVEFLIKGLPKTNEISLKDKEKIEKAEQAFNDLMAIEKESVSNQADLLAARKALDLLEEPKKPKPKPNREQTNGVSKGEDGKGKPGTDKPDMSNKGNVNSKPTGVNQRGNNSKPSGTNQRHLPQTSDHSSMVTPLIGLTVLVLGSVFIWKRRSSESK